MAKQKIPIVGIVAVVGILVLVLATGGGFFKNFSIQNSGLFVSLSPQTVNQGSNQVQFQMIIYGGNAGYTGNPEGPFSLQYFVDDQEVIPTLQQQTISGPTYLFSWIFSSGTHTFYIVANETSTGYMGTSAVAHVNIQSQSNPTPTPTPSDGGNSGGNLLQQIISWIQSVIQGIENFFKSLGL
jgi:hypothetical protein